MQSLYPCIHPYFSLRNSGKRVCIIYSKIWYGTSSPLFNLCISLLLLTSLSTAYWSLELSSLLRPSKHSFTSGFNTLAYMLQLEGWWVNCPSEPLFIKNYNSSSELVLNKLLANAISVSGHNLPTRKHTHIHTLPLCPSPSRPLSFGENGVPMLLQTRPLTSLPCRAGLTGGHPVQLHRSSPWEGPCAWFMFYSCCSLEILNNFEQGPLSLFCTGPHKFYSKNHFFGWKHCP